MSTDRVVSTAPRRSSLVVGLTVAFAWLFVWTPHASAYRHPPGAPRVTPPTAYIIKGYIDRAPERATVVDQVEISAHGEPERTLLVTSYRAPGEVMLGDYLSWPLANSYSLSGNRDEVHRLLTAPRGTRVEGTFLVYAPSYPLLVIANLEQPSPKPAE